MAGRRLAGLRTGMAGKADPQMEPERTPPPASEIVVMIAPEMTRLLLFFHDLTR